MIRSLSRSYACRWGVPAVARVDTAIFYRRYFVHCMQCSYCFDSCCQYGADIDVVNIQRLSAHAPGLEAFTGVPRERWSTDAWTVDAEFPGRRHTRTRVEDGACVFRNRNGRGCMIHSYAVDRGLDYHDLKPMVCTLFPVTFDDGLLHPSTEIEDGSLQCIDDGATVYRGIRDEIAWYFGESLVRELDEIERRDAFLDQPALAKGPPAR